MEDIKTREDVGYFVNSFYKKVQGDELIGKVFAGRIAADQWPKHLDRMTSFWTMVLLGNSDYRGNPFRHHVGLGIGKAHFDRWISLFNKTILENFEGPTSIEAMKRAEVMRVMFESKLAHINSKPNQFPIL